MQWMRFRADGRVRLGVTEGDTLLDLTEAANGDDPVACALSRADIPALLAATPDPSRDLKSRLEGARSFDRDGIEVLAPIAKPPNNIVCVGRNFFDHAVEAARFRGTEQRAPQHPIFFTKPRPAITDPDVDVNWDPTISPELDYEGEVALVIGRGGRDISPADAMEHIWGLTLMNDLTARDVQARHVQYYKGKGLDESAPMGPLVLELRDIPDVAALELRTKVNGELRQQALLSQLIFDIPTLIASWSRGMTIEPGDVLATGTPAGVGAGFEPPRFLRDGDVIEIEVDEIGVLRNRIRHL